MDTKVVIGAVVAVVAVAAVAGVAIGLSGSGGGNDDSVKVVFDFMDGYEAVIYAVDFDGNAVSGTEKTLESGKSVKMEFDEEHYLVINLKSSDGYKFDALSRGTVDQGAKYTLTVNNGSTRDSYTLSSDDSYFSTEIKGYFQHYEDNIDIELYPDESGLTYHIHWGE